MSEHAPKFSTVAGSTVKLGNVSPITYSGIYAEPAAVAITLDPEIHAHVQELHRKILRHIADQQCPASPHALQELATLEAEAT